MNVCINIYWYYAVDIYRAAQMAGPVMTGIAWILMRFRPHIALSRAWFDAAASDLSVRRALRSTPIRLVVLCRTVKTFRS